MRRSALSPEFVEFVPAQLEEGKLYISVEYGTSVHLCACGCGNKVVAPISPADWQLIYDGDSVSLRPSIGNWQFPCQSHYWIRHNRVEWARQWSPEEIEAGRRRDADDIAHYYESRSVTAVPEVVERWSALRAILARLKRTFRRN